MPKSVVSKPDGRYKESNMKKFGKVRKTDDKSLEKWGVPGAYIHTSAPLDPKDTELVRTVVEDMKKAVLPDGEVQTNAAGICLGSSR